MEEHVGSLRVFALVRGGDDFGDVTLCLLASVQALTQVLP